MDVAAAALQRVGAMFQPLRSPDDVAAFLGAEAAIPEGTPRRASMMAEYLLVAGITIAGGAWAIERLTERLGTGPHWSSLVSRLRRFTPAKGNPIVLVSPAMHCASCTSRGSLVVDERPSRPTVFTGAGTRPGLLFSKECSKCGARHSFSFATGGHIAQHLVRPLPSCLDAEYFQTYTVIYARFDLLHRFKTQATHSHTAFETFCAEYYTLTGDTMQRSTFAANYLVFALLFMLHELKYSGAIDLDVRYTSSNFIRGESPLNRTLRKFYTLLSKLFVVAYGNHHANVCRLPTTCICYILDGHMKCRRPTCDNTTAREVMLPELGTMVLGCNHTPVPGSRFCYDCREAVATSLGIPCQICDDDHKAADDAPASSVASCSEMTAADSSTTGSSNIHGMDSLEDVHDGEPVEGDTAVANDEWLVECLQEERSALKRNEGTTNRTKRVKECMRARHKEYLVKFVGYDDPIWVCQCDIGAAVLARGVKASEADTSIRDAERNEETAEWKARHTSGIVGPPSTRTRHAGERAASMLQGDSGDFQTDGQEEDPADPCLNNLKENQYAGKIRRTTAGVLALVSSCGLFLAVDEIVGSESLKQVHAFLYAVFCLHGVSPPRVLGYDDACHLLRWWQLREAQSKFIQWLLSFKLMKVVVDRFHFRNHVGKFCKAWNDPAKCLELVGTQTEAAEQSFAWLARSKHTLRYMSEGRFQFMVLHLMHERNKWLIARGVR